MGTTSCPVLFIFDQLHLNYIFQNMISSIDQFQTMDSCSFR